MPRSRKKSEYIQSYIDSITKLDYKTRPVGIEEFVCSNKYLGKSTREGKDIYPVWMDKLKEVFSDDRLYLIVLTGAIGTGKTFTASIIDAYVMYLHLCLRDPWRFYRLGDSGKMAITFFNLTKSLGASRAVSYLNGHLVHSPWFLDQPGVRVTGSESAGKELKMPLFDFKLASPRAAGFGVIGENVIKAGLDEVDDPAESVKIKERILKAYEVQIRRFESRFVIGGESLGKITISSSKQQHMAFLEAFVDTMRGSPNLYVADVALWEAKPASNYSGKKFYVFVGDKFNPPRIIKDLEDFKKSKELGEVIAVPVEYQPVFLTDTVGSLRDIAGRSSSYDRRNRLIPSESFLRKCYDQTKRDPFPRLTLKTGLNDKISYIKLLDLSAIRNSKSIPRHIHIDIAFSGDGDALGFAMSGIKKWVKREVEEQDGTFGAVMLPVVETDLVLRIQAQPGDRIPLNAVRKLVLDLRAAGFNIEKFTADLRLACEDTLQILSRAGIKTEYYSVDTDTKPYYSFRDCVLDERWICHFQAYLNFELINLEDDGKKVDHPATVRELVVLDDGGSRDIVLKGSKDLSDPVAATVAQILEEAVPVADIESMKKIIAKATQKAYDTAKVPLNYGLLDIDKVASSEKSKESVLTGDNLKFRDLLKRVSG